MPRHSMYGSYDNPYRRGRPKSRKRSRVAKRRGRDAFGRFLNPVGGPFMNPLENPRRGRRKSRARSMVARHRARDAFGRFLNPFTDVRGRWHHDSGKFMRTPSYALDNPRRSRARSMAAKHRRRDRYGRFLNPFMDRRGRMHHDDGRYMNPSYDNPYRRGRPKSRARSRVAKHRARDSFGRFLNPFMDSAGRWHRNDGKFAKHRGRKRVTHHSRARSLAAEHRARDAHGRFLNPFMDSAGRWHRNDGKYAKRRGRKAGTRSRRRRTISPSKRRTRVMRGPAYAPTIVETRPFGAMIGLDNPYHRGRPKSRKRSRVTKHRRRDRFGRFLNPVN